MESIFPNPSNVLPAYFKINRQAYIRFTITVDDAAPNVSGWTWQLFIKRNPGARLIAINLTLGFGLSYETYSDIVLVAHFTSAQTDLEEGEYYWELVRTDIETTWIEGKAFFEFAKKISETVDTTDYTINVDSSGSPVEISISNSQTFDITISHDRGTFDASAGFPTSNGSGAAGARMRFDRFINTVDAILAGQFVPAGGVAMALADNPTSDWDTLTGWKLI